MLPVALYFGDVAQVALALISGMLAVVSVVAYRRRPETRYLMLMLAFVFLCAVSVSTALLELFVGVGPATVQFVEVYLNPSLELLMVASFLVAVLWSTSAKRHLGAALLVTVVVVGVVGAGLFVVAPGAQASGAGSLPAGCARPPGGFLIVASSTGYNDSIGHGAPLKSWPVLEVAQGADVSIMVCNTYTQALGFQVTHYLAGRVETILPGQVLSVSFVANQTGTFDIYCAVFNPIHLYLQGGELNVL